MRKFIIPCVVTLILCACATPQTVLKHPETGQVAKCGGNVSSSMAGGAIGYHIQKNNDNKCVDTYLDQGFQIKKIDGLNHYNPPPEGAPAAKD